MITRKVRANLKLKLFCFRPPLGQRGRSAVQVLRGDSRPGRRVHEVGLATRQRDPFRSPKCRLGGSRGQADTAGQEAGQGTFESSLRQGVRTTGRHREEDHPTGWYLNFVHSIHLYKKLINNLFFEFLIFEIETGTVKCNQSFASLFHFENLI